ncbi:uncharacterized protein LOC111400466 [Olea europaea var. sylvestris]|uniref:uncharacterized protein LOC111400466 n=1 Tax=Olea europaea var. sylvestris TaxID=158386 RepID=UPI000C1CE114|nr:uncharacterized protein LOC111400466 [Olea europaea var. sylvestris]
MASKDKFKIREYPAPDMASILRATSTVEARPLKLGSSGAKEVWGRVEHLSKDKTQGLPKRGHLRAEAEEAKEEAAKRATEAAEEEATKQRPARVQWKSLSFLVEREEVLAPALVEALPPEIGSAIESFYKFWTDREALTDFQTRTQSSKKKMASLIEELKGARVETEEARAQKLEDMAKLKSALAWIKALKKEVYESQCKVASLTEKVEVSNDHQKVTAEALEKTNLELAGAQEAYKFLEGQIKWYVDNATKAREEAHEAREEAVNDYIANFHNTEEYKSFSTCWRNFAYAKMMERAKELYPDQDLSRLRLEFVDEVPQTPADEAVGDEVAKAEEESSNAQAAEAPAVEAPPSSSQA